jgi:hypothetical protein
MRHKINYPLVYLSAITTGLLSVYIMLAPPTHPIPFIIGLVLCAAPCTRAIVLEAMRKYGYPY